MQNTIEPPVLLSRLMTFVFASALVVMVVLIITLSRMYPLDRTQIFFLTTQPRENLEIQLASFSPSKDLEVYKLAFIKEYIKARNEIFPNAAVMQRKWANTPGGSVRMWSTSAIYNQFLDTTMANAILSGFPLDFRCPVEFTGGPYPWTRDRSTGALDTYEIRFRWWCETVDANNNGHGADKNSTITLKNDYTVVLKLQLEDTIKWTDRLQNPLGMRVSEYRIESGNGDPLDAFK